MKFQKIVQGMTIGLVCAGCASDAIDPISLHKKPKIPFVAQEAIPSGASWTPPQTQLPRDFVQAVAFLQAHGLPDPRGGKFVQATIPNINFQQEMGGGFPGAFRPQTPPLTVYGWLIGGAEGHGIVTIDGAMRTDVLSTKPASLSAAMPTQRYGQVQLMGGYVPSRYGSNPSNEMFAALLLIAGDTARAEKLLETPNGFQNGYQDPPFLRLADEFLSREWARACAAFQSGDDQGAQNIAKELVGWKPEYEKEATAILGSSGVRNLSGRPRPGGYMSPNSSLPTSLPEIFPALSQANILLAETTRRLAEGPHKTHQPPDSDVAGTIDALEDVGVGLANRSPYKPKCTMPDRLQSQLVRVGDHAIEPLIQCAESDKRLSRHVTQDMTSITIEPVSDIAIQTLQQIAQVSPDGSNSGHGWDLASFKKWWATNKRLTKEQRIYQTLLDDQAAPTTWFTAFQFVVAPQNQTEYLNQPAKLQSSEKWFRAQKTPSVSTLFAKRLAQLSQFKPFDPRMPFQDFNTVEMIAEDFYHWDPKASLSSLRTVSDKIYALHMEQEKYQPSSTQDPQLLALLEDRINSGDRSAITAYGDIFAGSMNIYGLGEMDRTRLTCLYEHRNDPGFKRLFKKLFLDPVLHPVPIAPPKPVPGQPMVTMYERNRARPAVLAVVNSPLLNVPEVREAYLHLLKDKTKIGTVGIQGQATEVKIDGGGTEMFGGMQDEELMPKPGEKLAYRNCDEAARSLQRLTNGPNFMPYWPLDVRDKTIKKLIDLIEHNSKDEVAILPWPNDWKAAPEQIGGGPGTGGLATNSGPAGVNSPSGTASLPNAGLVSNPGAHPSRQ